MGKVFRIQRTVGRSDPADCKQREPHRQHVNTACECQAGGRIESPCSSGTGRVKRTDPDDSEIPGAGDDGPAYGIRKYLEGSGRSLKDVGGGTLQHLCQRWDRSGKNNSFKCTLRVYPARRARDHDRRRGGAAVKPHRKSGTSGDPGCQCRGSRGNWDRRADPGGSSYETGGYQNKKGKIKA